MVNLTDILKHSHFQQQLNIRLLNISTVKATTWDLFHWHTLYSDILHTQIIPKALPVFPMESIAHQDLIIPVWEPLSRFLLFCLDANNTMETRTLKNNFNFQIIIK